MSDQLQPVIDAAVEAAHREISYPIGIVRSADGGRSITRFALQAAAPILTASRDKYIEELEGKLEEAREGLKQHLRSRQSYDLDGLVDEYFDVLAASHSDSTEGGGDDA